MVELLLLDKNSIVNKLSISFTANGPNPKNNPDLDRVIKDCQSANIQKATVQKWIENFVIFL